MKKTVSRQRVAELKVSAGAAPSGAGPQKGQPGEQPAKIVACGGEREIDGFARRMGEVVSRHAMLGLQMADDWLDGRAAAQLAFDGRGDAPFLARDIDLDGSNPSYSARG